MSDCSTHAYDVPLKSCPFCGGEAYTVNDGGRYWTVECHDCAAHTGLYATKDFAIAAWNSRAPIEYEGWFYLPKPKEGIVDYGEPEITRTENGYKVRQIADVVDEAARRWGEELGDYVMKRICEAWNSRAERTCHDTDANPWHFICSACGYEQNGYELWNYCPNCGARVVE